MTREIKFRVWDADSKKYWNIENWHVEDEYIDLIEPNNSNADPNVKRTWKRESDVVIEQFTGLKDIAGTDIYENDWVIMYQEDNMHGQVVYNPETGILMIKDNLYHEYHYMDEVANYIKVTGNIHQNRELLEEDEWLMNQLEQYILVGYRVKPFTKSEKQHPKL